MTASKAIKKMREEVYQKTTAAAPPKKIQRTPSSRPQNKAAKLKEAWACLSMPLVKPSSSVAELKPSRQVPPVGVDELPPSAMQGLKKKRL